MIRAIISGATGFLGTALTKFLLNQNYEVVAVVRPNSENLKRLPVHKNLSIIELNLSDIDKLPGLVDKSDLFFHLAWSGIRGNDRNNEQLQLSNFECSKKAVLSAHKLGCSVFVASGSQAECGVTKEILTETTPLNPLCEYGKAKIKTLNWTEHFCNLHNMRFIWARIFSLYGPFDYKKGLINTAIDTMLEQKDLKLSECTQLWDYLHVDDACRAIFAVVNSNVSGIVNIANGNARPLKSYLLNIKELLNSTSALLFGEIPTPPNGLVNLNPDISLLQNIIGFTPSIDFTQGIKDLIERNIP